MIDLKDKDCEELWQAVRVAGHVCYELDGQWVVSNVDAVQAIIDAFEKPMPDLWPVQFHFMLNKYGFKDVIDLLLATLKTEDKDKYDMYDAYLNRARFYEFDKTLVMFNEIREKFTTINSSLNFTDEQLKQMWLLAKEV